ncbi:disease resistance protein (TIR-NBS-LRR class), partial [Trifolium medium]|nr:disease resistance protein (TIR-NBS-LRR class) [Trifolium medium]
MERFPVVDEEYVIVSGNDNNNVTVSGADNEAINQFGEGMVKHLQLTRHTDGWYADVAGPVQFLLHDLDQPAEAVAEEICAAKAEGEQQVPLPDGQPNLLAAATPETIGPVLGAQILDALKELRADFARQDQTVTARLNAVEVRLEELEDVISQIPRGSSYIL